MGSHELPIDIPVIYEDDQLVAINKPAGLLSIPDGYNPQLLNLQTLLREKYGGIWTVHRLDKETSGVIIFAKTAEAHRQLNSQFDERSIKKDYQCVIVGEPEWEDFTINLPLKVNGDRKHRTVVHSTGKAATTKVHLAGRKKGLSYLVVKPGTGYTHQIRAHLAAEGFTILGDVLYKPIAERKFPDRFSEKSVEYVIGSRLYLHAQSIVFFHPIYQTETMIEAPLDDEFLALLAAFQS